MRLAELNGGYALYPLDNPRMAGFMDSPDKTNALAERSHGYVWRMRSDSGNVTNLDVPDDEQMIANMSVWEVVTSLGNYVFNTIHAKFYEKLPAWFENMTQHHFVMWWVENDHTPTLDEAMERLAHLQEHDSSDHAFGWNVVDQSAWRRCEIAVE